MSTTPEPELTDELTPQQWQVIALLTQGQSVTAVAKAAGIHRTTIHHWRRTQPAFALALHDEQADLAAHYRRETQARADKALIALDKLLDDERTPATVRLKAVLHVLNTATTPPAPDPVEAELLARAEKQRWREMDEYVDAALTQAEYLRNMSDEEISAHFSQEALEAFISQHNADEAAEDVEEAAAPVDDPIHHNSSLFAGSSTSRNPNESARLHSPATVHQPTRQSTLHPSQTAAQPAGWDPLQVPPTAPSIRSSPSRYSTHQPNSSTSPKRQ